MDLYNETNSIEFYNNRYKEGYMEDWPLKKKQRIMAIIKSMDLPVKGDALDYGCGNGVFSAVLKEALPDWEVFGSDISEIAIENATKRFHSCTFFTPANETFKHKKFDLIFSHHVLEHVYNIDKSCEEVALLSKPGAALLHILPCGNEGSVEYTICKKRINGIDNASQNRFFYEDPGHLRRLKSRELAQHYAPYDFKLKDAWFANQYYGALDWITNCDAEFIKFVTDGTQANGVAHKLRLSVLKYKLLLLFKAKSIERFYNKNPVNGWMGKIKVAVSKTITGYYMKKADNEWLLRSKHTNGSEMFLYFKRNQA